MLEDLRLMLIGKDPEHGTLRGFETRDEELIGKVVEAIHDDPPDRVFSGNLEGHAKVLRPGELGKMLPRQGDLPPPGGEQEAELVSG